MSFLPAPLKTKLIKPYKKNVKPVAFKACKVKASAVRLLEADDLLRLSAAVKNEKGMHLQVFFTAKTHKKDILFDSIVSERGTWHFLVSGYLQNHLAWVQVEYPFVVSISVALVNFLKTDHPERCDAFSVDVQDLYYSLPHVELMISEKMCISEHNDET